VGRNKRHQFSAPKFKAPPTNRNSLARPASHTEWLMFCRSYCSSSFNGSIGDQLSQNLLDRSLPNFQYRYRYGWAWWIRPSFRDRIKEARVLNLLISVHLSVFYSWAFLQLVTRELILMLTEFYSSNSLTFLKRDFGNKKNVKRAVLVLWMEKYRRKTG